MKRKLTKAKQYYTSQHLWKLKDIKHKSTPIKTKSLSKKSRDNSLPEQEIGTNEPTVDQNQKIAYVYESAYF